MYPHLRPYSPRNFRCLCWMYVTWKMIEPKTDTGFDLSKEYKAALVLLKKTD